MGLQHIWINKAPGKEDDNKAFKWFLKAVIQEVPIAQFMFGMKYVIGIGVFKDFSKTKDWIKKAYENQKVDSPLRSWPKGCGLI